MSVFCPPVGHVCFGRCAKIAVFSDVVVVDDVDDYDDGDGHAVGIKVSSDSSRASLGLDRHTYTGNCITGNKDANTRKHMRARYLKTCCKVLASMI